MAVLYRNVSADYGEIAGSLEERWPLLFKAEDGAQVRNLLMLALNYDPKMV